MISISMFNNKGGVGKTTLTCNIASYFAKQKSKKVLVVDCDPQCNSTQLIMGEEFTTYLYTDEDAKKKYTTISDILWPIEVGEADIIEKIATIPADKNKFGLDVLPGHPGFLVIEDRLSLAWWDLKAGEIAGFRKTNWNTRLCQLLSPRYEYVFFDLGPSLGSINRSVLVGCDYFITPMGTDIFSILGIKNIAKWFNDWISLYSHGLNLCRMANAERLKEFQIKQDLNIKTGYLGYTIQQYITKSIRGERRPTRAYEEIIKNVPSQINTSLGSFYTKHMDNAKLGDVPHLYSLVPLAQSVAAPILALKSADGLVGSQFKQREDYGEIIRTIVNNIIANLGESGG